MSREFEVSVQNEFHSAPDVLFEAVTAGSAGWLWPMDAPEPMLGGSAGMDGQVIAWDPPHHYASRIQSDTGYFNELEFRIGHERHPADGSTFSTLSYCHSGIFLEDFSDDEWAVQYAGVTEHTAFYLHTLGEYVQHFPWQNSSFASVTAPSASNEEDGFARVIAALDVDDVGDSIALEVPNVGSTVAVVDYLTEHFLGLRTKNSLIRFFGRNAFGAPVAMSIHEYGGPTMGAASPHTRDWQSWLTTLYS